MSTPVELSFDEILKFMLAHNGKVTNYELVKHFKVFLMNPDMRDEARNTFKKHVNALAIIKNQNNEKWLILKKKYMPNNSKKEEVAVNDSVSESEGSTQSVPYQPPPPLQLNQDLSILTNLIQTNNVVQSTESSSPLHQSDSSISLTLPSDISPEDVPPKVHPRRKSADKAADKRTSVPVAPLERTLSTPNDDSEVPVIEALSSTAISKSESMLVDNEHMISVKERKQMFNRMASEGDMLKHQVSGNLSSQNIDEEDRVSLDPKSESDPLDSKQKQWILNAARGDYHALAKMCKENAKLVKTKDPFTTAMHWACKRGDENLVKLLAGAARHVVYERSNGGYTPLHIAMQFRHENLFRLLVEAYDADPNARDWSGRKPRQYLVNIDTSLSPGSYRKKEGFLRIGSLNVRVKKTTEAFSNFLGVGATRSSAYMPKSARDRPLDRNSDDATHKSWGSADNLQKDDKLMPPPNTNSGKVRRRGATGRRGLGSHSRSTPTTPDQPRARIGSSETGDSDSDSAAGFHSAWRQQRASNCT
ncbi:ankyrin repeat domain-containing protein SOWAHC isoform X2 [Leguminivora glycinivorella]|uniref:ankyrin repeat domain-containing protein SOWAHC isoform X2 n=1 Tax=Leguminivora glycinivorella TaxID=1035111 RepID=UPI00200E4BE2|nr:ankyrin repeat domain-containing protein SOWAHC isoform X2 [Leguminivora glycinivorella]